MNLDSWGMDISFVPYLRCGSRICPSFVLFCFFCVFMCVCARVMKMEPLIHVARGWSLTILNFYLYVDWLSWFVVLRLQGLVKKYLETIFYLMWWHVWAFRNAPLFTTTKPRIADVFDKIVTQFFLWCNTRNVKDIIQWRTQGSCLPEVPGRYSILASKCKIV